MPFLPEVYYELLDPAGVEEQVSVGAAHGQVLYLFSTGCLIVVTETNHCGVVH